MVSQGARCFLFASGILFIIEGLLVGGSPSYLSNVFGILVQYNELHIFRSIMGVSISLGILYIYGSFYKPHTHIILNVERVIVTGLIIGRSYSLLMDGYYHWSSVAFLFIDMTLFVFCSAFVLNANLKKD